MSLKSISARDNPHYRALLDLAENGRSRRGLGQTLLDGPHLAEAALDNGVAIQCWVFAETFADQDAWLARAPGCPAITLPEHLFRKLTPVQHPTGLLARIAIPHHEAAASAPQPGFAVLLENVQDPGNLGSLLRTAAAAGVEAAYLSKGCAEAWSPKALRGGQGAQFVLRIHEQADLTAVASNFPGPVYAAVLGAGQSLHHLDLTGPVAFAFGNEGAGLSQPLQACATGFQIPMAGRVESLNVAAAAAICLFERLRQAQ